MSEFALHTRQYARRHQRAKCIANDIATEQDGCPQAKLIAFVPLGQEELQPFELIERSVLRGETYQCPRKEGGFNESQKESRQEGTDKANKKSEQFEIDRLTEQNVLVRDASKA
jgi:hypothetical protein